MTRDGREAPVGRSAVDGGLTLLKKGRADVFRLRERTRRRRLVRAIIVIRRSLDGYLWYRYVHRPAVPAAQRSPPDFIFFLPVIADLRGDRLDDGHAAVLRPVAARHRPPRADRGRAQDVKGLDTQVDEVVRTSTCSSGYATFREELGGNPRRGILFEGPPGTGKTYLAKAMAKQAGVPFLFISAPAFQSMWYGMTAVEIRSFFKALRKARAEGGRRDRVHRGDRRRSAARAAASTPRPTPTGLARTVSNFVGGDAAAW